MTSQIKPISFKSLMINAFKKGFNLLKHKIQSLKRPSIKKLSLSPIEQPKKGNTKWVLAETTDIDNNNKQLVLVEVEQFNEFDFDHNSNATHSFPCLIHNYTIEGEDPNLRITHYPSNRLH
ncbi:MAG: hypothetical protein JSS07_01485 [Proteobacteria bacterium]|nr:hypothetical protein [Pseudomonadota bacterium]